MAVGAVAFICVVVGVAAICARKQRKTKRATQSNCSPENAVELEGPETHDAINERIGFPRIWIPELDRKAEVHREPQELSDSPVGMEGSNFQLRAISAISELSGSGLSETKDSLGSELPSSQSVEAKRS